MKYLALGITAGCLGLASCAAERVTPPPADGEVDCPVISSSDWLAWVDAMPGPDRRPQLHVTGRIDLPTPGYTIAWQEGPADRMQPPRQVLELRLTPPDGVVAQVITSESVHYVGDATYGEYRAILVRCGSEVICEITDITVAQ